MKKKELLKHIPENQQEPFIKRIRTPDGKALMTVLPDSKRVHFTWGNGYLSYYPEAGIWAREKITAWCYVEHWPDDEESIQEVRSFCGGLYGSPVDEIKHYEDSVFWKKQCDAQQKKYRRIQQAMKAVPAMPPHFVYWLKKRYQKAEDKYQHIHFASLYQRMPSGKIVERIFRVQFFRNPEEVSITEIVRGYANKIGAEQWNDWYYGTDRNFYGTKQHWWDKKIIISCTPKQTDFYTGNLEELGIGLQGREIIKGIPGPVYRWKLMEAVKWTPDLAERAVKAGLGRCLREFINAEGAEGVAKMADALERIGRQKAKRLIQMNANSMMLITMDLCPKVTDETLKEIGKIRSDAAQDIIADIAGRGLNINHVWTLMMKTGKEMSLLQRLTEYRDYLDMAARRSCDIHSEIIYRNKRWKHFHDQYVEELNRKKEEERAARFQGIRKDLKRNQELFEWQQDGYFVRPAESAEDIIREGRLQHHCVGASDWYMKQMAERKSWIVFLRKAEDPETPWYTVEVDKTGIRQAYAAYDRKPDWEEIDKVLKAWMKHVKKNFAAVEAEERVGSKAQPEAAELMAAG